MSDHTRLLALTAAVTLVATSAGAQAPSPSLAPHRAPSAEAYRRHVDSIAAEYREAVAAVARGDASRRTALPADTVHVGPITVVTEPKHEALVRRTVAAALPDLDRVFGARMAALATHPFLLRDNPEASALGGGELGPRRPTSAQRAAFASVQIARLDSGVVMNASGEYLRDETLAAVWRRRAAKLLTEQLDPDLRRWLGGEVPTGADVASWTDVKIALVTAASVAARRCYEGDIAQCRAVLYLDPVPDPAMTLYDAKQRQNLAHRFAGLRMRGHAVDHQNCVRRDDLAACDRLVRLIPPEDVPPPLAGGPQQSLLLLALQRGGPGAFERLAASTGTMGERLQAASGTPTDELVRAWRSQAVSAHVGTTTMSAETGLSALLWASLLGALALRSSRWR